MPVAQPMTTIDAVRGYIQQNDKKLIGETMESLDFIKDLPGTIRNLREERNFNKMTVDEGARPHNSEIEQAKGGRDWQRRTITPRYGMKIIKVKVQDERKTWQSRHLAPNAKREPFANWKWGQEFMKLGQELNNNFYHNTYHNEPADFDAGLAYPQGEWMYYDDGKRGAIIYEALAATNAGESPETHPAKWKDVDNAALFDGPGTIIAKEILDNKLTPVASGSYDHLNAYDAYLEQWNSLSETQKNKRPTAYASYDSVSDLVTHHNKQFGSGVGIGGRDIEEGKEFVLKGTGGRLKIKPVTWMIESRRIIMTDPYNLTPGIDRFSDMNNVGKVIEQLHGYTSIINWMLTFQIKDLSELHVNNQA